MLLCKAYINNDWIIKYSKIPDVQTLGSIPENFKLRSMKIMVETRDSAEKTRLNVLFLRGRTPMRKHWVRCPKTRNIEINIKIEDEGRCRRKQD